MSANNPIFQPMSHSIFILLATKDEINVPIALSAFRDKDILLASVQYVCGCVGVQLGGRCCYWHGQWVYLVPCILCG